MSRRAREEEHGAPHALCPECLTEVAPIGVLEPDIDDEGICAVLGLRAQGGLRRHRSGNAEALLRKALARIGPRRSSSSSTTCTNEVISTQYRPSASTPALRRLRQRLWHRCLGRWPDGCLNAMPWRVEAEAYSEHMRYSLLLAEDDAGLRDLIVRGLREEDFDVEAVGSGSELLRAYERPWGGSADPRRGPSRCGWPRCLRVPTAHAVKTVPVVFLTARDAVPERVAGFEAGGDDYVTKPFALGELAERVRALLRRSARSPALEVGGLRLDSVDARRFNGRPGSRSRRSSFAC